MSRTVFALWTVAACCTSQSAVAADLYTTNFNAPTYANGALVGQDGWVLTNSTVNPLQVANVETNGNVAMTNNGQDVRRVFNDAATVTSGSVYFSVDVNVSAAQANGDYALHFTDGGTSNFYARTYIRSVDGNFFSLALGTSSGTAVNYGTEDLPFNTTINLLVRYDFVAGAANDTGALYVNPTTMDGSGDTAYIAATTIGTDATTIGALALRQGSAGNAATLTVDNYSAFTVDPVPEPASLVLLGAGVLFMARRRK